MKSMVWLLRLLSILAAAITSLFVARDALNFGIIETLLMITLVVAIAVIAVAWKIRRES
jgi:hypothetical protein